MDSKLIYWLIIGAFIVIFYVIPKVIEIVKDNLEEIKREKLRGIESEIEYRVIQELNIEQIIKEDKFRNNIIPNRAFGNLVISDNIRNIIRMDVGDFRRILTSCPRCQTGHLIRYQTGFNSFVGCSKRPDCIYMGKYKDSSTELENINTLNIDKNYLKILKLLYNYKNV